MNISHLGLAVSLILGSVASASAMPVMTGAGASVTDEAQLVEVRGGCGFGEHRGPYGGCRINNGPRGAIRRSITGLPRGCPPGLHRGYYGRCR